MLEYSLFSKANFWTLKLFGTSGDFLKEKSTMTIYVSITVLQQLPTSCHPCLKRVSLTSCFPLFLWKHIFFIATGTLSGVSMPEYHVWSFQTLLLTPAPTLLMMADHSLCSLRGPHLDLWKAELLVGPPYLGSVSPFRGFPRTVSSAILLVCGSGWHTSQGGVRFGQLTFRQDLLSPVRLNPRLISHPRTGCSDLMKCTGHQPGI